MGESSTETGGECPIGSEGCPCTAGGSCDGDLVCSEQICTSPSGDGDGDPSGDGDGDGDPSGDGDGDPSGDGDGDPTGGTVCEQSHVIEIEAIDADEIVGWSATMSMLGEGTILGHDGDPEAYVSFNLAIPCDDFWHVWVRGIDTATDDSYFVSVDGQPDPAPVFELDCTAQPQSGTYLWRELNYREVDAAPCELLEDPWVQDWQAGFHELRLSYRESIALARIFVTNTEMSPR